MAKATGKQVYSLRPVQFEGTVIQNKTTPVRSRGLLMYRLKFRPDNRCSKQRGELIPVDIWGFEEAVDTILTYFIGIVAFLILIF